MEETGRQGIKAKNIFISEELQETQKLMPISSDDRERLENSIKKEGLRDPVKVYQEGNKFYLLAGWNRLEIFKKINGEDAVIPSVILEGTKEEYKEFTINDNLERRHFTKEQKYALINYFLKKDPTQSDRHIASRTKVDKNTVSKKRKELLTRGEIHHVEKKDSKGRRIGEKTKKNNSSRLPINKKANDTKLKARLKEINSEIKHLSKEKKDIEKKLKIATKKI